MQPKECVEGEMWTRTRMSSEKCVVGDQKVKNELRCLDARSTSFFPSSDSVQPQIPTLLFLNRADVWKANLKSTKYIMRTLLNKRDHWTSSGATCSREIIVRHILSLNGDGKARLGVRYHLIVIRGSQGILVLKTRLFSAVYLTSARRSFVVRLSKEPPTRAF